MTAVWLIAISLLHTGANLCWFSSITTEGRKLTGTGWSWLSGSSIKTGVVVLASFG